GGADDDLLEGEHEAVEAAGLGRRGGGAGGRGRDKGEKEEGGEAAHEEKFQVSLTSTCSSSGRMPTTNQSWTTALLRSTSVASSRERAWLRSFWALATL